MAIKGVGLSSYDEVFDAKGLLRPSYVEFQRQVGIDVLRPGAATVERLRGTPLADDARILPIPWVLDAREYSSVVRAGVAQRARALQHFFADLVLGSQRFLGGTSLTRERVEAILESEQTSLTRLRSMWAGHSAEEVRFVYGPDLLRAPDGRWLVLEDNVGCIGGSADSHVVWSRYLDALGVAPTTRLRSEPDLAVAVRAWLVRVGPSLAHDELGAVLGCEAGGEGLRSVLILENARRQRILEQLGIQVTASCARSVDARVRAILNFHALSELIEDAFRRGIALFNAPGTGVLGNKGFLPYVDEMIRLYCAAEPILATAATHLLEGGELPAQPEEWILKSTTGCQGTEVFELQSQPPGRLEEIRALVRESWPKVAFVAQRRVDPSHLATNGPDAWDSQLVELRPVTYAVGWSDVLVSHTPLGKAVSSFAVRRKHNVSQGACYVPVTPIRAPRC